MKQATTEGFDLSRRNNLSDDPERIAGYRAVSLAEGLAKGSEAQVLWAWQWLSDHPHVTNRLRVWFRHRVAELREMDRIR
jgi:Zn-dependent protease with chaperone function